MAKAGNDGLLIPEQVWDNNPPAGVHGPTRRNAYPLGNSAALVARAVRPAGLVDLGRLPGGAAAGGGLPLHRLLI